MVSALMAIGLAAIVPMGSSSALVTLTGGNGNTPTQKPTPPQDVAPPSEKITLAVGTINGSGCPQGTAAVAMSPDNTAFTVTYSKYLAQTGPGSKPTDFRKNCQLNISVNVPSGFTYAISQVDYRGYAHLEDGARGVERASYYFQGMSRTVPSTKTLRGPFDDNWQVTDRVGLAALVYAPCGEKRNLNINTELRVYGGQSGAGRTTNFMSMDSTDSSVSTVYHFSWQRCEK